MCMERGRGKQGGTTLAWDAARETTGDAEADKLLTPLARGQYDLRRAFAGTAYAYEKMIKPLS